MSFGALYARHIYENTHFAGYIHFCDCFFDSVRIAPLFKKGNNDRI